MSGFLEAIETGWGLSVVEWFNGRGFFWYLLYPLHVIGDEFGVMIVLASIFWAVDRRAGIRLMLIVLGSQILSNIFKVWWGRPRPYHVAPGRVEAAGESWQPGLPSGHTIFATTIGLWFANTMRRDGGRVAPGRAARWSPAHLWPIIAAVAFALAMGVSRLVHGVHYPQDVILGWVIGGAFFALFVLVERVVEDRSPAWRPLPISLIVAGVTALAFVTALLISDEFEARKSILSPAGALAGGIVGLLIERPRLGISTDGPIGDRLLRLVIGLPLLAGLALGLGGLFYAVVGSSESPTTLVLYTLRYAIVGASVTLGIPWLFAVIGVSRRQRWR